MVDDDGVGARTTYHLLYVVFALDALILWSLWRLRALYYTNEAAMAEMKQNMALTAPASQTPTDEQEVRPIAQVSPEEQAQYAAVFYCL